MSRCSSIFCKVLLFALADKESNGKRDACAFVSLGESKLWIPEHPRAFMVESSPAF
jgi:hypothetical protein